MPAIARDSLLTLEAYAKERAAFRARVLAHKRNRMVHLGPHLTLLFEDGTTEWCNDPGAGWQKGGYTVS